MTINDGSNIKAQTFAILEKNHEIRAKEICTLLKLDHKRYGAYIRNIKSEWKHNFRSRHALKCLSFHKCRGWIYALKSMDRAGAVGRGERPMEVGFGQRVWLQTRARNRMLLWRDKLGRVEWHVTGRINVWVKKPGTVARAKQLLANAFSWTGIVPDVQIFDLWADTLRFKGAHLVYDTGERLPYARIEYLKDSLQLVAKIGDVTHPTCIELEFAYPDWAERNERLLEQANKMLQQNADAFKQFSDFMKDLSQPKQPSKDTDRMIV